jgi:ankyrin repeat protein
MIQFFKRTPELTQREKNILLLEAIWGGDFAAVAALLKRGADANSFNGFSSGDRFTFNPESRATVPADISLHDVRFRPLSDAAALGHTNMVRALLRHGADIDHQENGETALMKACSNGNVAVVKLLLSQGADYRIRNGLTSPLGEAARRGHVEVVKTMLEHGIDVHDRYIRQDGADSIRFNVSDDPLKAAAAAGHVEVVKVLLGAGADASQVQDWDLKEARKHAAVMQMLGIPKASAAAPAGTMSSGPQRPGHGPGRVMTYDR